MVEGVYAEPGRAVRLWLFVTRSGLSCFLANYGKKKSVRIKDSGPQRKSTVLQKHWQKLAFGSRSELQPGPVETVQVPSTTAHNFEISKSWHH